MAPRTRQNDDIEGGKKEEKVTARQRILGTFSWLICVIIWSALMVDS